MPPLVSIITICLNDPEGVARTIDSVRAQDFDNLEFIIVDGGSASPTLEIYNANRDIIDVLITEVDDGIYDAMNKGIRAARGQWYIMMNAGDIFSSTTALRENLLKITSGQVSWGGGGSCIRYADGSQRTYFSDPEKAIFHQQSLFLRKDLHDRYGFFVASRQCKAWDYFFFHVIRKEPFLATGLLVSICDGTGVSSTVTNYLHVNVISFIFGGQSRFRTAAILVFYPLYRRLTRLRSPMWAKKKT